MGYRGFVQLIGTCGHQWEVEAGTFAHGARTAKVKALACPVCGAKAGCSAEVDVTNGYGKQYGAWAVRAPATVTGFTDEWKTDHYGNRYAVKHETFEPYGPRWRTI